MQAGSCQGLKEETRGDYLMTKRFYFEVLKCLVMTSYYKYY